MFIKQGRQMARFTGEAPVGDFAAGGWFQEWADGQIIAAELVVAAEYGGFIFIMPPVVVEGMHGPIWAKDDGGIIGGGFGDGLRHLVPRLIVGCIVIQNPVRAVDKQGNVSVELAFFQQPAALTKLILQGFRVTG